MRLTVKLAKRVLREVDKSCAFVCEDGSVFFSLLDLESGIEEMNDGVFLHHVSEGRNDFSNWIRDCFGDVRLADSLVGLGREDCAKKIRSRISYIEKYLEGKE